MCRSVLVLFVTAASLFAVHVHCLPELQESESNVEADFHEEEPLEAATAKVLTDDASNRTNNSRRPISDEQRLLRNLMIDYERAVRPVYNASDVVLVKLGVTLSQIADLDERNQVLSTIIWLDQEWVDQKMTWNPAEFGGLKRLRLPCHMIWLPDIVLYNSVDDHTKGYMQSLSMIYSNGEVFWPPIVKMRSSCKIDIRWFPFDAQVCHLKLGSWAYDGYQVDVTNRSSFVDTGNSIENGEWDIIATKVIRNVRRYPCCIEPFPDVTFYLHLQRRHLYYTMNIIIPCMMMSFLTMTTFALPAESGEKITLGLTVMLSFSVFMLLIAETMPPTAENAPLAGIYLTLIMGMSAVSIVMSVLVLNIFVRGRDARAPPKLLLNLSRIIAKALCYKPKSASLAWNLQPERNRFPVKSDCRDIPLATLGTTERHRTCAYCYAPIQTPIMRHPEAVPVPVPVPLPVSGTRASCNCSKCCELINAKKYARTFGNGYMNVDSDEPDAHVSVPVSVRMPESKKHKERSRTITDSSLSLDESDLPEGAPPNHHASKSKLYSDSATVARRLAAQTQVKVDRVSPKRSSGTLLQLMELLRVTNQSRKAAGYQGNLLDFEHQNTRFKVYPVDEKENKFQESTELQSVQTPQSVVSHASTSAMREREQSVKTPSPENCRDEIMNKCLSTVLEQQNYLELRERCSQEWQQVSVIFDRLFLTISIVTNILVSFFMLVVCPMIRTFDSALLWNVIEKDRLALIADNEEAARAQTSGSGVV